MKPLTCLFLTVLTALFLPMLMEPSAEAAEVSGYELHGKITADDQYYDRHGKTDPSGFLGRYQYYPSDEQYNRLNIPNLDLTLGRKGAAYPAFRLERFSPWIRNDRMLLQVNPARGVKFDLDYMRYRKNMDEYSPTLTGTVGTNYTAQFNKDTASGEFFVKRSKTDLSISLTSDLWGGTLGKYLERADFWIDNEGKDGQKFLTYILGESNVTAGGVSSRWRGRAEPFDSRVVNLGTELTLHPLTRGDMTGFLRVEREDFENNDLYTVTNVAALDGNVAASDQTIDFIPDAEKDSFAWDMVDRWNPGLTYRVGIRYADLDQQSFNAGQKSAGYHGEIEQTAFLTSVDYTGLPQIDLTGYYLYNQRKNNSQIGTSGYKDLDSNVSDPHVTEIDTQKYGADAVYRFDRYNTVVRVSGRREKTDRNFKRPSGSQSIPASASPYNIDSDRWVYSASLISRFFKDLRFTASTSYLDANDTALVLEPDKSWKGRMNADYALLQGRASISASYLEEKKENDNFTWTGVNSVNQQWESRHRSFSIDGWWLARNDLNLFGSYLRDAMLQDANWLASLDRRWVSLPTFSMLEKGLGYRSYNDTWTAGANYQINPKSGLLVSYLLSHSRSRIHSGTTDLGPITKLDNQYQNINVRLNHVISSGSELTLGYLYEDYDDDIVSGEGGRNQTLSLGYTLKF